MKKLALLVLVPAQLCFASWPLQLPWMNAQDGKTSYSSADYPTGVFVVEGYFNGCHWCHVNAPNVERLAESYQSNPRVQVLDVGVDGSDDEYESWISSTNPRHPVLKDPSGRKFLRDFHVQGYPTTLVLDCHGKLVYRHLGSWEDDTQGLVSQAVDKALASCVSPSVE